MVICLMKTPSKLFHVQWNPDFLVGIIGTFEKSGIKLQYLTGEWKLGLVWIIGNFKKRRV